VNSGFKLQLSFIEVSHIHRDFLNFKMNKFFYGNQSYEWIGGKQCVI